MAMRKVFVGVGAFGAFGIGMTGTMLYAQTDPNQAVPLAQRDAIWEQLAATYDDKIAQTELSTGINKQRRKLLQHAKGHVLEVGAGTGRNLEHYTVAVTKLTLTDRSAEMCKTMTEKLNQTPDGSLAITTADGAIIPVEVAAADVLSLQELQYDTVVDTFGLCSFEEPEAALDSMLQLCVPGGEVLLLEHGQSSWAFPVNGYLNWRAANHAKDWGCWWNRPIADYVQAAVATGACNPVLEHDVFHFGTGHLYRLQRPLNPS